MKGFTLIEVVIAVSILGIFAAIAIPNFARYQAKARQSEAKIALGAIFGLERVLYAEYGVYVGSMESIAYLPEGNMRFYALGWAGPPNADNGTFSGPIGTESLPPLNNHYTCTNSSFVLATPTGARAQTFSVAAEGCIRHRSEEMDRWTIDQEKSLQNTMTGL